MNLHQAIQVRIIPATDTQPKRWKAFASAGSLVISDDTSKPIHPEWDNLIPDRKALIVAEIYSRHNNWMIPVAGGILKNGDWVFVTNVL